LVAISEYTATERLRDGQPIEIRALAPNDRSGLLAAVGRTSDQSLYRRFFGFKRGFTEQEVEFYTNLDFKSHIALVAVLEEGGHPVIVGGARCIVAEPGRAGIAFAVDDAHQGQGIGSVLMRHLTAVARRAGLDEFVADVLPGNQAMLKVLQNSGLGITTRRAPDATRVVLRLS
jgi:GNAT superfamily N-acetyltransferase